MSDHPSASPAPASGAETRWTITPIPNEYAQRFLVEKGRDSAEVDYQGTSAWCRSCDTAKGGEATSCPHARALKRAIASGRITMPDHRVPPVPPSAGRSETTTPTQKCPDCGVALERYPSGVSACLNVDCDNTEILIAAASTPETPRTVCPVRMGSDDASHTTPCGAHALPGIRFCAEHKRFAAPTTEGPRAEDDCACDGVGMCNEHIDAMLDAIAPASPGPGAPEGTTGSEFMPTLALLHNEIRRHEVVGESGKVWRQQAERIAALTSEVARLTEERNALAANVCKCGDPNCSVIRSCIEVVRASRAGSHTETETTNDSH